VGLLITSFLASSGASAAVSRDVETLRWRRPVLIPENAASGWYAISEDSMIAAASGPAFSDLRVIDAGGQARALDAEPLVRRRTAFLPWREWPVSWTENDNGEREIVLDLGPAPPSGLSVELTGSSGALPFRITGRDSLDESWHLLSLADNAGPEYAPMKPVELSYRVDLGEVRRYLRLVQDRGGPAPSAGDRVRLLRREERWPARIAPGFHTADEGFRGMNGNEWTITIELTGPARAITSLDLERPVGNGTGEPIRVEARLPKGGWRWVTMERKPGSERGQADSLVIEPTRTEALRLTVAGADPPNTPFNVTGVHAVSQRWLFQVESPGPLWLAYGDPYLTVPAPPATSVAFEGEARSVALGPPEPNPFYREPGFGLEWLKRRPGVLGVVMVALLGLVAWLAMARRQGAKTA
jgi:hypothetical protein